MAGVKELVHWITKIWKRNHSGMNTEDDHGFDVSVAKKLPHDKILDIESPHVRHYLSGFTKGQKELIRKEKALVLEILSEEERNRIQGCIANGLVEANWDEDHHRTLIKEKPQGFLDSFYYKQPSLTDLRVGEA